MSKLGLICSVYNDTKYLRKLWGTIENISVKDMKFYFIDDFSTNEIISELEDVVKDSSKDVEIISMPIETRGFGAGAARNYVLDKIDDEYVGFVDADDLVSPTYHEKLIELADVYQLDCIKTGWTIVSYANRTTAKLEDVIPKNTPLPGEAYFKPYNKSNLYDKPHSWAGLYRKTFLDDNNIRFSNLFTAEDRLFWTKCLCVSSRLMATHIYDGYLYRKENDIRLTSTGNRIQNEFFKAGEEIINYVSTQGISADAWRKIITQQIALIDFHYKNRSRLSTVALYDMHFKASRLMAILKHCPEFDFVYSNLSSARKDLIQKLESKEYVML